MGYGPWGMEFWQLITLVIVFALFFKPRDSKRFDRVFADFHKRHGKEKASYEEAMEAYEDALDSCESHIQNLQERIKILERIVTDNHKPQSLAEEINNLRQ